MSKYSQRLQKARRATRSTSQDSTQSHIATPHFQLEPNIEPRSVEKIPSFDVEAEFQLAHEAQRAGHLSEAQDGYERILLVVPNHAQAMHQLGAVYRDQGDIDTAVNLIEQAIAVEPHAALFMRTLAVLYSRLGHDQKACRVGERAAELEPNDLNTLLLAGMMQYKIFQRTQGDEYYRRVLDLDPNNLLALTTLASNYERDARLEQAQAIVDEHLPRAPQYISLAIIAARLLRRQKQFPEAIRILDRAKQANVTSSDSSSVHFELGRIHEAAAEHDKAFRAVSQANDLQRAATPGTPSQHAELSEHLSHLQQAFTPEWVRSWSAESPQTATESPIFVFGFVRSGNTLLDQILKSHSQVQTLMEKPMLQHVTYRIAQEMGGHPAGFASLGPAQIKQLQDKYFSVVEQYLNRDSNKRFVDTHPMNTHNAGLMCRLFPDAKRVFVIRHPYDVCLSCFFQDFQNPLVRANTQSLEAAAEWYVQTMDLWQQYSDTLDLNYHTVRYESLVENFDDEVQSLCQYLDIPWQDQMRDFSTHAKQQGAITTASYHQVTEGLYRQARYRWRHYAKQLAPITSRLRPYAERLGYTVD